MSMPEFTAEASLGKIKESYTLTLGFGAAGGKVLPQGFCLPDEGGITCYQCWDEGGFSGCITHRIVIPRLF